MEPAENHYCSASELERIHLFKSADLNSIGGLLQKCPARALKAGELLITRGQPNYTLYLLLSGRLQVHLDDGEAEPLITLEGGGKRRGDVRCR